MALSPSETSDLLRQLEHRPNKKLGQNFLIDGNLVEKSISMASLPTNYPVLEIGPGLGTLTSHLLNLGHPVYAVEIDPKLHSYLSAKLDGWIKNQKLVLTKADAVKLPIGQLPSNAEDFTIVANLPYAISSPWMEAILAKKKIPRSMTLMLQKEASDRMWAKPGTKNYSALSIFIQNAFLRKTSFSVSKKCFIPNPAVDSVLVHMERSGNAHYFSEKSRNLIRRIFTKRRKQIGSLIKAEDSKTQAQIEVWLNRSNLTSKARPEEVELYHWKNLSQIIEN